MTSGGGTSGRDDRGVAEECLRLAARTDDPRTKANLMSIAASWQHLAEFALKNNVTPSDPPNSDELEPKE